MNDITSMTKKVSSHLLSLLSLIILAVAFGFSGCALNRPYPEKSSYMPDVSSIGNKTIHSLPLRIKIRNTRVVAPFEGKAFVYRLANGQWETDFYHEWFAYPRDMVTEACISVLTQSDQFASVTSEDSLIKADYYLEGTLIESYLDRRNSDKLESVLKTRWVLIPNKPSLKPVSSEGEWNKVYEERLELEQDTPNAYAKASATGLSHTLSQLVSDLHQQLETANR